MRFQANPNYYDYIHCIELYPSNKCRFIDGAGQSICIDTKGTYKMTYDNKKNKSGNIEFDIEDQIFKVNFKVYTGLFILMKEIIWNSSIEDWPFILSGTKYIFETDPFDTIYKNRENNLYFIEEGEKESKESLKCFYIEEYMFEKSAKELNIRELKLVEKLYPKFYEQFK